MNYKQLLSEFAKLPQPNLNPTFMDVCQMGGDRFEERCSQIWRFFLSPDAPHRLRDLVLKSLLEVLECPLQNYQYRLATTKIKTEETTTDNKRIDITIVADNFVIALENKIFASLYNPLDSYHKYIEQTYKDKEYKKYVVLSIRKISSIDEITKLKVNEYSEVYYNQLFAAIKRNLGTYALDCDQTYLTFLMDFIRTIENRYYNKNMKEMNQFFFDNLNIVEDLVKQYEAFKNDLYRRQCDEIAEIKKQLVEKTGTNWWIYQHWDLGITFNEDTNDRRIGIESNFETDFGEHNPLGVFRIFITVWDNKCFEPFRNELRKTFPDAEIIPSPINGRLYMHLPVIYNGNISEIVDKMENYYSILKGIVVSDI